MSINKQKIPLIDLHCDTPWRMLRDSCGLNNSHFHVSLSAASGFSPYIQCAAIWSDSKLSDEEAWDAFRSVAENFLAECNRNECSVIRDAADFSRAADADTPSFILTLEDARLLSCDIKRLDVLRDYGVKIITPLWGGNNILGGAHDSECGLTGFGCEALQYAASLGMVLDISHASDKSAAMILDIARLCTAPVLATHSCARGVYTHTRNITDSVFDSLVALHGVCGVSLCRIHLTDGTPTLETVVKHILHLYSRSPGSVCMGCDFDGTDLPENVTDISSLRNLYTILSQSIGEAGADAVFYGNAYAFLSKLFNK